MADRRRLPATLPPVKKESSPDSSVNPSSALAMTNRFITLGSTVNPHRPNYQSPSYQQALATPFDPFSDSQTPQPQSTFLYPKSSPYIKKLTSEYLFSIPSSFPKGQGPGKIVKDYLPPNFHYVPTESYKSLKFYQAILSETESIAIKPIYSSHPPVRLLYHSMHINRFLTEADWGMPLYNYKQLHSRNVQLPNINYNYFDYIRAWTNIFLHQTEDFSHSWFISFDHKFRMIFPAWFPQWWLVHGPTSVIIPESLMAILNTHFQPQFNRSKFDHQIALLALFMAKYKVPWILKWNYDIFSGELHRVRSVKWWDRFNQERIIGQVIKEFPIQPVSSAPIVPTSQSPKQEPASPSQHLEDISPSSSTKGKARSTKSTPVSRDKASQLKDLAQRLLAEAAALHSGEEEEEKEEDKENSSDSEKSEASTQQLASASKNWTKARWADYEDSQDPYDL